ncbi:Txe/YoeB family addiction module toxin [Algoriphagus boritolerans]|uniref:Putative mRNA interferase YoeB n=1 Tax=Algoriphagus boritolerans DSM 17298 = JCM 18970 TaxID=1120964 RepID=A0A1H5UYZ1_9BACT|nr:Txe/YoeB family addiction module toxin [Algoriphagus boritolerans]SEF80194.1 toxin YoeB [Algoriphagus boritolerans DSM 17298 = JCM 18970]
MIFEIDYTFEALEDIEKLKNTGNKVVLKKLFSLIQELKHHPETGTGKPERLKHYQQNTWSRRIDKKNRLVYLIDGTKIVVTILGAYGHYGDK